MPKPTRAALRAFAMHPRTARLVLHRRAYYRSLASVHLVPRSLVYRGRVPSLAAIRRAHLRMVAQAWAEQHYAPARAAFLAELAALCNKHQFQITITEYDGPIVAMPRKRGAKPFTARTVLPEDY